MDSLSLCLDAAQVLRERGYNPLPSCPVRGYPPFSYSAARDKGLSPESFAGLALRYNSTNIQICTGIRWKLFIIDVDGEVASMAWEDWTRFRPVPMTWTVRTPSGGRHYWFTADSVSDSSRRFVWFLPDPSSRSGRVKHEGIEFLGDRWLARCPPSVRLADDGECLRYEWEIGPDDLPHPRPLPDWIGSLPSAEDSVPKSENPRPNLRRLTPKSGRKHRHHKFKVVRDASFDRLSLALGWGLEVLSRPGPSGWMTVRALGREDRHPSARFHSVTGRYRDWAEMDRSIDFFEFAARFGPYASPSEACNDIGDRLGLSPERS
jgi:hypothetical protein